jgi:hypothetical protein
MNLIVFIKIDFSKIIKSLNFLFLDFKKILYTNLLLPVNQQESKLSLLKISFHNN